MVIRKIYFKKHFIALLITLLFFSLGVIIGIKLSGERTEYMNTLITQQKLKYESLQLQLLYLDKNNKDCQLLLFTLEKNLYDLEQQRFKLEQYIASSNDEEYLLIKKEYILTEIRYWMLAQDAKNFCNADFTPLLYFYLNEENCELCSTQGHILTYVKDKLKDKVLIFSLDASSDEPMVDILKNTFNITQNPSIVIGDVKYDGLTTKDIIFENICLSLTLPTPLCEEFLHPEN